MDKINILTTPIEFDKSDYLSLLSLSAGTAIARQNKFGEVVIGDNGWNIDIRNRRIKFGGSEFDCGIVGSESEFDETWLWGWANTESNLPENVFAPSRRAKRILSDCAEFQTAKFGLDEIHTGHNLSMITAAVSEKNACYYRCPYEGGAVFAQIEGLPEEIFAPITLDEVVKIYVNVISMIYCDHKLLAAGLLHTNGYSFEDKGNALYATSEQKLQLDFEEIEGLNRVVNISFK